MNKTIRTAIVAFLVGMAVMYGLDMVFHFNNSIEAGLKREVNKTQKSIENIFK